MGVSECDNMLMLLGVSDKLTRAERDIVTPLTIKGFTGRITVVSWYSGKFSRGINVFANLVCSVKNFTKFAY